jgi:glutathione S-transferase
MLPDPDLTLGAFFSDLNGARRLSARAAFPVVRRRMAAAVGLEPGSVARAFAKVETAARRVRAELQPNGHLVGDGFTVADLTLASLLAPVVAPTQFPYPQPQRGHPLLAPVREALAEPGLLDWTCEMYARWRGRSAELVTSDEREEVTA